MSQYILIPHLNVQRANVAATPWLISPLPVFAATMLGHALGSDTGQLPSGVGYLHHHVQMLAESDVPKTGKQVFPHQFRAATYIDKGDYSHGSTSLSLQPTFSAHLRVSMVLRFEDTAPSPARITEALKGRRLAGGLILDHGKVQHFDSWRGSEGVQASLNGGFWAIDRHDLLASPAHPVESMLSHLHETPPERFSKGSAELRRPWRNATVLGYAAVTPWQHREGVRDNALHAFAEPLVGMVDLISSRYLPDHPLNPSPFWKWSWPSEDVFLLAQD